MGRQATVVKEAIEKILGGFVVSEVDGMTPAYFAQVVGKVMEQGDCDIQVAIKDSTRKIIVNSKTGLGYLVETPEMAVVVDDGFFAIDFKVMAESFWKEWADTVKFFGPITSHRTYGLKA